ncbi:nucleoside-specific outer membrane channel protein Tsx [Pseudoduganella flava]|uniref:Nucleoside-specific outer membrane channel protein Tsx n=1 Tax=Pseudoduganella flava TaxID=871742 RepID=A0A562PGE7_9BURK|nr:outer envelope protein [Pseudoduganella flava]QGZ40321.1 outer envelope protein [Pseudoduganella flava]TWI43511.1 nucleoside-specific outer membrane channel protein Tsx [Pseudoduganella flava]
MKTFRSAAFLLLAACGAAHAADWSDTSLSYRYGTKFAEPYNEADITKHVVNFSHVSGYKYGKNFFSIDYLISDENDPSAVGSRSGAHEAYAVYRHTLDLGKISGANLAFGPVRGVGVTAGFDINSKTDAGYNSKKRMLVAGPTLMFDVPGFLDVSLLALHESNAPYNGFTQTATDRYRYKTHAMLTAAWGIPFSAGIPLSFEGFANYIGTKGKNEFGGPTAVEINVDMQVMYDLSAALGAAKNTFKVGVEYQYWKNKFGNPSDTVPGATARTPMVRAEYHF